MNNIDEKNILTLEFLKEVIDTIPGGVSIIRDGEYLVINKETEIISGINYSQIVGHKIGENLPLHPLVVAIDEFRNSEKDIQQLEMEFWVESLSKKQIFFVILRKTFNNEIVILSINIQEKKDLEKELEYNRIKLQNSAKLSSLGEMASGISHEINNPLQVIEGQSELMLADIEECIDLTSDEKEVFCKRMEKIKEMSSRIASIIRGLRTFARDAEKDPMQIASTKPIILDTLAFCRSKFANYRIDLDYEDVGEYDILCRPTQISQVVLNLLHNSFDAVVENPNTDNRFIKIKTENTGSNIVISVIDSGLGISESVRDKVLNPFFTTKPVGKGTGLGLSISKGIIEDHAGKLYFDYSGINTVVKIELPIAECGSVEIKNIA